MTHSVTTETFRTALSLLGGAANIVTTDGPAGRQGLTATAVCSITEAIARSITQASPVELVGE